MQKWAAVRCSCSFDLQCSYSLQLHEPVQAPHDHTQSPRTGRIAGCFASRTRRFRRRKRTTGNQASLGWCSVLHAPILQETGIFHTPLLRCDICLSSRKGMRHRLAKPYARKILEELKPQALMLTWLSYKRGGNDTIRRARGSRTKTTFRLGTGLYKGVR